MIIDLVEAMWITIELFAPLASVVINMTWIGLWEEGING